MHTFSTISLLTILFICLLTGCTRPQSPSPSDTISQLTGNSSDLAGDYGLEDRSADDIIANGQYGDRTMLPNILEPVYFGFDSTAIAPKERIKLKAASDYLTKNPDTALLIEGHCDWYGTAEYNLALGDRRASSASKYIETLGIDLARIETLSKGSLQSISGLAKDQSFQDRRVDLIILK
jgi:peptidoglycan-associated lipoprotein